MEDPEQRPHNFHKFWLSSKRFFSSYMHKAVQIHRHHTIQIHSPRNCLLFHMYAKLFSSPKQLIDAMKDMFNEHIAHNWNNIKKIALPTKPYLYSTDSHWLLFRRRKKNCVVFKRVQSFKHFIASRHNWRFSIPLKWNAKWRKSVLFLIEIFKEVNN